ncbi:hypothetical protein NPIL_132631 [Nephila pilipes]|uniref:Uncharacterized protein n=1 Tax=Nephila pilipes TaxID=299642 RepID=A0A8X6PJM3_NEPPI|nr:hypothetical protein NPIL_132631 [Nephila pilipes]
MAVIDDVRSEVHYVLSFVLYKYNIIEKEPKLGLTDESTIKEFIGDLKNVVWIQSHLVRLEWQYFLERHFRHMISSPKLYATFVIFACYKKTAKILDCFDCFLHVLTLVAGFAAYASRKGYSTFTGMSVEIVQAFYDEEIYDKFNDQGGWKEFSKFLQKKSIVQSLDTFNDLANFAETPYEIPCISDLQAFECHSFDSHLLADVSQTEVEGHEGTLDLVEAMEEVFKLEERKQIVEKLYSELVKYCKNQRYENVSKEIIKTNVNCNQSEIKHETIHDENFVETSTGGLEETSQGQLGERKEMIQKKWEEVKKYCKKQHAAKQRDDDRASEEIVKTDIVNVFIDQNEMINRVRSFHERASKVQGFK